MIMKKLKIIVFALLGLILSTSLSNAQDYKHPYGLVSKEGKLTDSKGEYLGSITKDGTIKDAEGTKIAQVGANGNLVDAKTGKVIGHAPKNGTFVYYFDNASDTLTTSYPMNGTCEVKNSKGEIVIVVHENYKHNGACAYHCLALHKKGQYMKMK